MKYKLLKDIPGYGKEGEIKDFDDISDIPYNSKLELVEEVKTKGSKKVRSK